MKKFGTFSGVFVPSYEAILGAVLFLILPVLVAGVGLSNMLIIVVLANTATLATAFSIADCTTNLQRIGGGGMFAVSKRSLGKAFGGSIGIQLFLAQSASIGFYAIAFADPLQKLLAGIPAAVQLIEQYGLSILVQKQIIGTVIAVIAFIAGLIGADFIVKIQMVIFIILTVSVGSILISPGLAPTLDGMSVFTPTANMTGVGMGLGFWGAFAAFFPAVTGIDAGVGMSGSLKDPRRSLAKGTFMAIGVTFLVYTAVTVLFGFVDPGIILPQSGQPRTAMDFLVQAPVVPLLILTGILFATGSSALSYFMTAPRTAQALANDDVLPGFLSFLGKDFKRGGAEPRWATLLTFLIVVPVIWSGDVTFASTVVGICFLVVYGWVNLSAFLERVSGNPSFRPTSKGHWTISLYGFLICMIVISLFNPLVGVIVFVSQITIFSLLLKYKSSGQMEGVWWGVIFSVITYAMKRMRSIIQGTKNWRPVLGVFCFSDRPEESRQVLEMASRIGDFKGMMMVNVLKDGKGASPQFNIPYDAALIDPRDDRFDDAIDTAVQAAGPGGLSMNSVFLPLDKRINLVMLIERLIGYGRNVFLHKPGVPGTSGRIDVWWKGEANGNLMALISFILTQSYRMSGMGNRSVRMIRRLMPGEEERSARNEIEALIQGARLNGEAYIIPHDERGIHDVIQDTSKDAELIFLGMPGKSRGNLARLFSLDKMFFSREIEKFKELPPVLFIKAARVMDLLE